MYDFNTAASDVDYVSYCENPESQFLAAKFSSISFLLLKIILLFTL